MGIFGHSSSVYNWMQITSKFVFNMFELDMKDRNKFTLQFVMDHTWTNLVCILTQSITSGQKCLSTYKIKC